MKADDELKEVFWSLKVCGLSHSQWRSPGYSFDYQHTAAFMTRTYRHIHKPCYCFTQIWSRNDWYVFGKTLVFWHINMCPPSHDDSSSIRNNTLCTFLPFSYKQNYGVKERSSRLWIHCPPYQNIFETFETLSPSMFIEILGTKSHNSCSKFVLTAQPYVYHINYREDGASCHNVHILINFGFESNVQLHKCVFLYLCFIYVYI